MNPEQPSTLRDDVDAEGHPSLVTFADGERDEASDTEGHGFRQPVGRVSGQTLQPTHPRADDEDDDVAGHRRGALRSKKKTEHDG